MKTRKRTPRKVLSLLLCVLMVATSVVFANPFTTAAADITDRVTFDPSRYGNYTQSVIEPSHTKSVSINGFSYDDYYKGGTKFYEFTYDASGFSFENDVEKAIAYHNSSSSSQLQYKDYEYLDYESKLYKKDCYNRIAYFCNIDYGDLYAFYDYRTGVITLNHK